MKFAKFSLSLVIGFIILISFVVAMMKVFAVPLLVVVALFVAYVFYKKANDRKQQDNHTDK